MNKDKLNIIFTIFTICKFFLISIIIFLLLYDNQNGIFFHLMNPIKIIDIFFKELSVQSIEKLSIFIGMILFFKFRTFFINYFRGPIFSICFVANFILLCMLIFQTSEKNEFGSFTKMII